MTRRRFLADSVSVIAGMSGIDRVLGAEPCPPSLDPGSVACGLATGSMADAAASLSPGQSVQFTKNTLQDPQDIQWQATTIFYDQARQELQYMGKPATSQSANYAHYIYHESTDTWTTTGKSLFPGTGHIWNCTFDPINGDYWFRKYNENVLRWYDRSAGSWKTTVSQTSPALNGGNTNFAAMGWHPNLFGGGNPGIFIWAVFRFFAYNPSTGTFSVLNQNGFSNGDPYANRANGTALYLPSTDQLVCFAEDAGAGGGHRAILVDAGAGNSSNVLTNNLVRLTSTPPLQVFGGGGSTNHGHVVNHPNNESGLLLLEEHGSSRVWQSQDSGGSWQLQPYGHPFQAMQSTSAGEYTVGTVAPYGIVVGMTSDSSGGETVLWKPAS